MSIMHVGDIIMCHSNDFPEEEWGDQSCDLCPRCALVTKIEEGCAFFLPELNCHSMSYVEDDVKIVSPVHPPIDADSA